MRAAITPLGGGDPEPWLLEQLAHSKGLDDGMRRGQEQGLLQGHEQGYHQGYAEGNTAGYNEAIDEANAAIERLQAQHVIYQQEVAERYQAYESERDKLKQLALNQAAQICALEEQLAQRDQSTLHYRTKIDNLLATHQRLTQESAALQEQCATLTLRIQSLLQERAELDEKVGNLTLATDTNLLKYEEQAAHYNKTLTFVNSILGAVKATLELNPELEDSFSKLFADEYKKSVEFRILVDDIKTAPHEDSDFALLLPQTQEFILAMLKNEHRTGLSKSD